MLRRLIIAHVALLICYTQSNGEPPEQSRNGVFVWHVTAGSGRAQNDFVSPQRAKSIAAPDRLRNVPIFLGEIESFNLIH